MAGLPAAVEKDVKRILAPGSSAEEIEDALSRAFENVKWPGVRMVPRVEDLTSEQRELVTRLRRMGSRRSSSSTGGTPPCSGGSVRGGRAPKKLAQLELIHQLQLGIAGKRADTRDVPPAQRFAEEGFGAGFLEICKLTDASSGKHRYDALLFRADSGVVFEARAKRVVAEIIQDGVECKSAALRDAIEAALADRPRA